MSVTLMFTVAVLNKPPESSAFISYTKKKDVKQLCLRGRRTIHQITGQPKIRRLNSATKLSDSKIVDIVEIVQRNWMSRKAL